MSCALAGLLEGLRHEWYEDPENPHVIRYRAWEAEGTFVVHPNPRPMHEAAIYSHRWRWAADAPHLRDGVYVEIAAPASENGQWRLDCQATRPGRGREQIGEVTKHNTFTLALIAAVGWLRRMGYPWCGKPWPPTARPVYARPTVRDTDQGDYQATEQEGS